MAKSSFRLAKSFDRHLNHPRKGTSLHPLGDALRQVSDGVAETARDLISGELARKTALVLAIRNGFDANGPREGHGLTRALAEQFALKSALDTTVPYMTGNGTSMIGRVIINRTGSSSLEYGGEDSGVVLGRGSNERPNHPAYAFLRRALDRA